MALASTSPWVTGLAIPALLALGGLLAWVVRSTFEDIREAERQLAEERRALYRQLLEPFLVSLESTEDPTTAAAKQQELFDSPEYRRAVFDVTLFASDEVVRAFGDITNTKFDEKAAEGDPRAVVLWARFLLAIRKSVGNKGTSLSLVEILRPTIKDMDQVPEVTVALEAEGKGSRAT